MAELKDLPIGAVVRYAEYLRDKDRNQPFGHVLGFVEKKAERTVRIHVRWQDGTETETHKDALEAQ